MTKLLIALQFWEGDKAPAMETARLIADLEPQRCEKADFLFSARFDATHDPDTVEYVSKKFNVLTHVNKHRRGVGWPFGCNDLWFGTMDYVFDMSRAKRIPDYKAILTMESDASPISPYWINRLSDSWDKAKVKVHGPLLREPGLHINGNAMFSGEPAFLKLVARDIGGCSPHGGWDYILADVFRKQGWADCPIMRSYWGAARANQAWFDGLLAQEVAFLHGVKDDSIRRMVREKFIR